MRRLLVSLALVGLVFAADAAAQLVDLNTASQEELESLPGIGEKIAKDIIENRPYTKIDDLLTIPRFGAKRLAQIRALVSVDGTAAPPESGDAGATEAGASTDGVEAASRSAPDPGWSPPPGMKQVACWRCLEHFCVENGTEAGVCPYCGVRWKEGAAR